MKKIIITFILILLICTTLFCVGCGKQNAPASTTCVITFDSMGGSSVAPIKLKSGDSLTFPNAPTKAGYTFQGWFYDTACKQEVRPHLFVATKDITFYAYWLDSKLCSHAITMGDCDNGEVKASENVGKYNDNIMVYPIPDEGYNFVEDSIAINGKKIKGKSFFMPAEPVTITAEFEKTEYKIILLDTQNGTIEFSQDVATMDTYVSFSVQPAVGYYLSAISCLDAKSQIDQYGITTINSDAYISAEFSPIDYNNQQCSVNTITVGQGSVSTNKTNYAMGEYILLNVKAEAGYMLQSITINGNAVQDVLVAYSEYNIIKATFVAISTAESYKINIENSTGGYISTQLQSASAGDVVSVSINAEKGYIFDSLLVNGVAVKSGSTFIMPAQDVELGAIFLQTFAVNKASYSGGEITADRDIAINGEYVYVNAVANTGYKYIEGSLKNNGVQIANGSYVRADADLNLTAEFAEIANNEANGHSITINSINGVQINSVAKAEAGQYVVVEAIAESGYRLVANSLKANGIAIENGFIMPTEAVVITYQVERVYAITIESTGIGGVLCDVAVATVGELVDLQLVAGSGYYAKTITINNKVILEPTFTMPEYDVTVAVVFAEVLQTTSKFKIGVEENKLATITVVDTAYEGDNIAVGIEIAHGYSLKNIYYINPKTAEKVYINATFSMPNCNLIIGVELEENKSTLDLQQFFDNNVNTLGVIQYSVGYTQHRIDIASKLAEVGSQNYSHYISEYLEITGIKNVIIMQCTDSNIINIIASLYNTSTKHKYSKVTIVDSYIMICGAKDSTAEWLNVITNGIKYTDNYTYYTRADGSIGLFDYNGKGGQISIPKTIGGRTVTWLDHAVFDGERDTITAIYLSNLREIDGYALANMPNITHIDLSMITSLQSTSVYNNVSLTAFYVHGSTTKYSTDNGVLYDNEAGELMAYPIASASPKYTIRIRTTSIASYAFYGTNLEEINTNNNTIETVGEYAFYNASKLKELGLLYVSSLGDYALYGADNLTNLTFNRLSTIGKYALKVNNRALTINLSIADTKCTGEAIDTSGTGILNIYVGMSKIDSFRQSTCWGSYAKYTSVSIQEATGETSVVYFESNGGTYINCLIATKSSTITEPQMPIKAGYEFVCWCTDEACTTPYDFNKKITSSTVRLYAKYIII